MAEHHEAETSQRGRRGRRIRRAAVALGAVLVVAVAGTAAGAKGEGPTTTGGGLGALAPKTPHISIPIETRVLENGLRVVVSENHSTPNVAIVLYYDVGSRNEEKGRSGFAHLFEHMMFRGSASVEPWEHVVLINSNGGTMNATTWWDRTNYYEVLPSHQLELGLWLEADRMASLAVTEANFVAEREAVKEERRMRYENAPYMLSWLRIHELAYVNWAYGHSTIGEMKDLEAATVEEVRGFWERYYTPNNCVLAVAGDVTTARAFELVEKHFGDIPRGAPPPPVRVVEPPQTGEKHEIMKDKFARLPAFLEAYHIPPGHTTDRYAMDLLAHALTDGESSRLYKLLVLDKEVATEVDAYVFGRRGPDLFYIDAKLKDGKVPAEIRKILYAELKKITEKGISDKELAKAKNRITKEFVDRLARNFSKAETLAESWMYWGDPRLVNSELDRYLAVSLAEVNLAAAKYLTSMNRTVIDVIPEPAK